jgi:hypothetical protein
MYQPRPGSRGESPCPPRDRARQISTSPLRARLRPLLASLAAVLSPASSPRLPRPRRATPPPDLTRPVLPWRGRTQSAPLPSPRAMPRPALLRLSLARPALMRPSSMRRLILPRRGLAPPMPACPVLPRPGQTRPALLSPPAMPPRVLPWLNLLSPFLVQPALPWPDPAHSGLGQPGRRWPDLVRPDPPWMVLRRPAPLLRVPPWLDLPRPGSPRPSRVHPGRRWPGRPQRPARRAFQATAPLLPPFRLRHRGSLLVR